MTNQEAINLFEKYYLTKGNSPKSTKDYCWWLNRFLTKPFEQIVAIDILSFVSTELLSKGRAPSTANQCIAAINAFYKAMDELDIHKNTIKYSYVKDKTLDDRLAKRDYLVPENFMKFVMTNEQYFRTHVGFINCRKWVALHLMVFGALRKSEIKNITPNDVVFDTKENKFAVSVTRKGGKRDCVYLPKEFEEPLNLYLKHRQRYSNGCRYLLCTSAGKQLYDTALNNDVTWMCNYSGMNPDLWPHGLRHAASDFMVYNEAPIAVVSSVLGHKNTSVTMKRYIRKNEEGKKGVTDIFSNARK